jgi:hypothetical protein
MVVQERPRRPGAEVEGEERWAASLSSEISITYIPVVWVFGMHLLICFAHHTFTSSGGKGTLNHIVLAALLAINMGNDGGSIPYRIDLVKTKAKEEKTDEKGLARALWLLCALSKVSRRRTTKYPTI